MERDYQIVDPGLGLPNLALDSDTQIRCLSFLMRRIGDLTPVPLGVLFELIPVEYLGGPYPAIGLYTDPYVDTPERLCALSFVIAARLQAYVGEVGLERLRELSSGETVRWQDVLAPYEEALRRARSRGPEPAPPAV